MRVCWYRRALLGAVLLVPLAFARPAAGQDGGVPATDTSTTVNPQLPPVDPRIAQLQAFIAGALDVNVSPSSLFDIALEDPAAVSVEAARVRALLQAADEAARPTEPAPRIRSRRAQPSTPDAGGLRAELSSLDAALWDQRLELDRARLTIYELTPEQRSELLARHAARQEAARPRETSEERLAREAEAERAQALEAARVARSEAERLVSEELARLISLEAKVREVQTSFQGAREELALRRDTVLGWQRRVRDAKSSGSLEADATYDALRRALRTSRDDLTKALDLLRDDVSAIPELGPDPLLAIPAEIPTETTRERRVAVERSIRSARIDEKGLRDEQASTLLAEIDDLNRERLSLLPALSPNKREAITGFTAAGWDQAKSEARHLSLILRYHQYVAVTWISTVKDGGDGGVSPWRTTAVVAPLLLVALAFSWGRRRTQAGLRWGEARWAAADRAEARTSPSLGRQLFWILLKIHRPLEWTLFFLCVYGLLPTDALELLEVQLAFSMVGWTLAGSLTINTINAFAAGGTGRTPHRDEVRQGELRLRSLRLVGRTAIAFALLLVLSTRLVGEGTIYSWVSSASAFAAIPVLLVLVRWWRGTVFDRLDRLRKKSALQAWILANRSGWRSFGAATVGAVQLFATGAFKVARAFLSNFDLARRIHAYLFRREIERLGEGHGHVDLGPLPPAALEKLHPEQPCRHWLPSPNDELREALIERAVERRGGLVAVVAARGLGKTSLLSAVQEIVPHSISVGCQAHTELPALEAALTPKPPIILVDDAHRLIEARIGGLARLDEIVTFARAHSRETAWVFALDASMWPLLKRARDARPIFDEIHFLLPWDEAQLGALIAQRSAAAKITPNYDSLLEKLPSGADEIDRHDALQATRAGYERMLWDHVGGNPGLALEAWRVSLSQDDVGEVHVRPLQVPDASKLEALPDSSLFVLRAVLQSAPTTVANVAQATRLRPEEVDQDFRFGRAQGYYEDLPGGIQIAWPWLRAVKRLLERRHLLVNR